MNNDGQDTDIKQSLAELPFQWLESPLVLLPQRICNRGFDWPSGTLPGAFARMWLVDTPPGCPNIGIAVIQVNSAHMGEARIITCQGVDYDPDVALIKARSEAVERVAAFVRPIGEVVYANAHEIKENLSDSMINFLQTKTTFADMRWWISCNTLVSRSKRFLPIEFVQLQSICSVKNPLVLADSTGMAVHPDENYAIENGINEVFEKTVLKFIWRNGLPRMMELTKSDEELELFSFFYDKGCRVYVGFVFGITRVFCIALALNENGVAPALVTGLGAHKTQDGAKSHALFELYAFFIHAMDVINKQPSEKYDYFYNHFLLNLKIETASKNLIRLNFRARLANTGYDEISKIDVDQDEICLVNRATPLADFLNLRSVQCISVSNLPFRWEAVPDGAPPF